MGIDMTKIQFPCTYGDGLIGVGAKVEIPHRGTILSVPYSCIISLPVALNEPTLAPIYESQKRLFASHLPYADHLTMFVFLLYEFQKGKESKWYAYINNIPNELTMFGNWDEAIQEEC